MPDDNNQPLNQTPAQFVTPAQMAAEAEQAAPIAMPSLSAGDIQPPDVSDVIAPMDLATLGFIPLARNGTTVQLGGGPQTNPAVLPAFIRNHPNVQLSFASLSEDDFAILNNRQYLGYFRAAVAGQFESFTQLLSTAPPKTTFTLIAQLAYLLDVSDIHIEPQADTTRIRFRIDGVLHPITTVNTEAYKIFLSDLQARANIKWGTDQPQNGRITFDLVTPEGITQPINMRIETIPAFHGEEIVVRLFNRDLSALKLDNMGYTKIQQDKLNEVISHFSGMVLLAGPTGSGKTSALYSAINKLNSPELKIITLEDPVEYDLAGITQIPVHTEDTDSFADKLRAVLREDPNVIMIGEIRDADTARTAMQAALTGHLVLSTFHAATTASAVSRLEDMLGANPLLATALKQIIAQRLVRRVCPHCSEEYVPTTEEKKYLSTELESLPQKQQPDYEKLRLRRGKGCAQCHGLGYLGRIVIAEQLVVSTKIQELMGVGLETVAQKIEAAAVKDGMITILQDGLLKVAEGITTLEEVRQAVS
jgi:type II secretory ATPase GspE/PulE/Tfp pilus assembly ATPase PilB-like protein